MGRFTRKSKDEIGRAPDELFFRGDKKIKNVRLRVIDFDSDQFEEVSISKTKEAIKYKDKESVTWFNIDGLHNAEAMRNIALSFELDHLVLADVMDTHSRPKVHDYDNCVLVSIKMMQMNEETGLISVENLSIIIMKTVLISFQERDGDVFDPVRERIKNAKRRIRKSGVDYLMYALLDIVIDNYIYIISNLGEKIEAIEGKLLENPSKETLDQINLLKKELNFLRKNINPAQEMILALSKLDSEFINESSLVHFKELVGNINQAVESSDSYREILSDQLNIYHTTISSKLNDVMKFLTVFSVIFIPLTFIAGIYGTNFDVVPELKYKYSYFIMWGVMIVIAIGMLIYFKRKKWL
ncbi:Cobalt/magnesium transport protein CorA [Kordia antarctica]|uniref:Magnesium transport protein CorA n=1 Tax=Kordia antarctica TaxID=1218801 RepID=A0A7L4ZRK9_9FLAO|nr:magnesium/cobalt transporter CorA [Kordia antarctica]QHI39119.1 Cobalt/magnesium transport protein CorA [Kordia antarctica]